MEKLLFGSMAVYDYAKVLGKTWRRSLAAFFVGVVTIIAATVGISAPANAGLSFYPHSLHGKIYVLLTEQPWSNDEGHFGGFHTTGAIEMNFESKGGDLVLEDHRGWISEFTVTQTIPAGSGTCTAKWPFVNEHIDGSVGGFHESSAKELATVSLDFLETVVRESGTANCGADLEETTHPFGEDPGRFYVPIQSTGTYAHGDITLRSTSKQALAGATLVVRMDGTLHD
jgi:hypothetical protein